VVLVVDVVLVVEVVEVVVVVGGVPPAINAVTSAVVNARLCTNTSSIVPRNNSCAAFAAASFWFPPMINAVADAWIAPDFVAERTNTPFTYNRNVVPSNVPDRCTHVFTAMIDELATDIGPFTVVTPNVAFPPLTFKNH